MGQATLGSIAVVNIERSYANHILQESMQIWQRRKSLMHGHHTPSFASRCTILKY